MATEFERKRWEKDRDPNNYDPVTALRIALDNIENGNLKPEHVIVVYHDKESVGFYQAGKETPYGASGILFRAAQMMLD